MLTDLIRPLGRTLRPIRPGIEALASSRLAGVVPSTIEVSSPAFADGGAIPERYTQYGIGLFPQIGWTGLPAHTLSVVLLVEDADIPFFRPAVHLIVHTIPPALGGLGEGEVPFRLTGRAPRGWGCGRNFLARPGWTAPAPPPGHGPHRYAFQVFALNGVPRFRHPPGRAVLLAGIRPYMVAQGRLIGTYERV